MNGRNMLIAGALVMLVGVCLVAGIGMSVYNMGVVRGMYDGGRYAPAPAAPVAPPATTAPSPYYGPVGRHGGGILGFIGTLFGIIFLLVILRCLFLPFRLHRHMRRWGGGPWGGVPPFFEEWHRQAHGPDPSQAGQGQPPNPQWQQPNGPWQTPPPPTAGPAPER